KDIVLYGLSTEWPVASFILKADDWGIDAFTGVDCNSRSSSVAIDCKVVDGLHAGCIPVIADLVHWDLWEDAVVDVVDVWVLVKHLSTGVLWDVAHVRAHVAYLIPAVDQLGDGSAGGLIRWLATLNRLQFLSG